MAAEESFYESAEFQELWRLFNRHYLPWDEFKGLPMPEGVSAERVWRAIATLRKGAGTTFDYPPWFPSIEKGSIWFFTPKESQERLRDITQRAARSSHLARSLGKLDGYYFCQYLMLDEFLAACESDGVAVERTWAHQAALHGLQPRDDGERLFANLCTVFAEAEAHYTDRGITFGLFEEVVRDLSSGIEDNELGMVDPIEMADQRVFTPTYVLDLVCRIAQGEGASDRIHPVIASIEMSRMFWDLRPLGRFNACVELIVRKLFYLHLGFPACAYLAFTSAERTWGRAGASAMGFSLAEDGYPEEYRLFGIDGTLYHDIALHQYEEELDRLEAKVDRFIVQRKAQRERILALNELNDREKDVLLDLLRNPLGHVTIEQHRARHTTAYSTAHNDLAHLEELGLIACGKQGRSLAYFAGSKLIGLA